MYRAAEEIKVAAKLVLQEAAVWLADVLRKVAEERKRWVLPGLLDVIASFLLLHSIFISEDLPTLDLPIKANSGNFCFGFSEILVLLPENSASEIFITIGKDSKSF